MRCLHQSTFPRYQLFHHSYAPTLLRLLILVGHLLGSVTVMVVALVLEEQGCSITIHHLLLTFPICPVTTPPVTRRRPGFFYRPGEAFPFGRPYRTHLNGYRRNVSPRWCHPFRGEHHGTYFSEAFSSLVCALTIYLSPPIYQSHHQEIHQRDQMHSSLHSARPSRKRCRSPVDSVPSSMPVIGSLAPTRADLLPPRKRFKDSYSSDASTKEDTKIDPIETEVDMELGISDGDDVRDHVEIDPRDVRDDTVEYEADTNAGDTVEVGIDPMSALIVEDEIVEPAGEDSSNSSGTRDGIVRSFEDMMIDLDDVVRDFYHHVYEVRIDRIVRI
ncbi:hypothetical protein Tco_0105777 [Tanacetum coccineum]